MKINLLKIIKSILISAFVIVCILIILPYFIPMGFATIGRDIVLSYDSPRSSILGIELFCISNQTATIKIRKTGELVSANKGGQFNSQHVKRLYLIEINNNKKEIVLRKFKSAYIPAIKGVTH